jgi:hypothetical protein
VSAAARTVDDEAPDVEFSEDADPGLLEELVPPPDYWEGDDEPELPTATRNGHGPDLTLVVHDDWPAPPHADAYHGLLGEFVEIVEPASEADPVALLANVLVMAGNAIGRRPYYKVEADRHHANVFVVAVGDTSKARKGIAVGRARAAVVGADPEWEKNIASGLSSGEGLIYAVRDKRTTTDEDGGEKIIDEGVTDKRLLCIEPEFSSVLRVATRDGNTVSAQLRQAWDSGVLRTLTRKDPLVATDAHISVIGHITREENSRYLDATEIANGFANRFLWLLVRRSKLLPEGGDVSEQLLRDWSQRLYQALDFARRQDEVRRDPGARELWAQEYVRLSQARPGLVGALLARGEAHVLRLSLLYALLDTSATICVPHLRAALALWDYAERSVIHMFGGSTGNPDADTILRALKANKRLSRTEISGLFGRHRSASQIDRALTTLLEANLVRVETEQTTGRPTEYWYAK